MGRRLSGAIAACDANGKILDMNGRAAESYDKDGERSLIGKSLLD
jgi:PAS domain-containing protein